MEKQNRDILNNVEPDECEIPEEPLVTQFTQTQDNHVELHLEQCDNAQEDLIQNIVDDTIRKYKLNRKQKVAFNSAIENVIKRHKGEETKQFIGYVGGPGGTGKSQVLKQLSISMTR